MIFIGQSRSGKTTGVDVVEERLRKDGYIPIRFDDKDYLMSEAIMDMRGKDLTLGKIETDKTVILNPEVARKEPRKLQLIFKDGRLLNTAHRKIMHDIGDALRDGERRTVVLADLAYGTDVSFGNGREQLLQSGRQFVRWFVEYGIMDRHDVLVREITAPFNVRAQRNELSAERIETKEFALLFPDIGRDGRGFFAVDRMMLGDKLRHIDNGRISLETYLHTVHGDYETNFRPRLDGEGRDTGLGPRARR